MTDPLVHCEKCRDLLDPEDLFCSNCGHEAAPSEGEEYRQSGRIEVHRFECAGCGATLTWELAARALRCAFCGREELEERAAIRVPAPRLVAPFAVDRSRAEAIFREWLGRGIFRPGGLHRDSTVTEMRGVYLPYWSFAVRCQTYWTADSDETPSSARADWAPHSGGYEAVYQSVLVPASGALTLPEVRSLGAYDLAVAVPYAPEILAGQPSEAFAVTRKRARLLAAEDFAEQLEKDCAAQVPGSHQRNLRINPLYTGTTASPTLLPVWIMAYEYGGNPYRFLVNGQTGKAEGTAPLSPWRVGAAVLLGLLIVFLVIFFAPR